ncbi:MAG: hypothetical protein AAGK01_02635 [Pseudomonadota bacterium]
MDQHVWVSSALNDVATLGLDVVVEYPCPQDKFEHTGVQLNQYGMPVPVEQCPIKIVSDVDDQSQVRTSIEKGTPDLFLAKGHVIVSEKAADIISQFDLGAGALYPVVDGVFHGDGTTKLAEDYFSLVFGNSKSAFLPDQTPEKDTFGGTGRIWNLPWTMSDDNIAVSNLATDGADVWVDQTLFKSFFLSGDLGDALDKAGLRKAFYLYRARVC